MISRKNRFHGHRSVSNVRGPTVSSSLLSIRYGKNNKDDYRLAVVVSRKISGLAVVRNRIRRRIFEIIRKQRKLDGLQIDVVVYVKDVAVAKTPHKELSEIIEGLTKTATQKYLGKSEKK